MSDRPPFHATVEGRSFYGLVMPEIATQLARIAKALEALAERPEHEAEKQASPPTGHACCPRSDKRD